MADPASASPARAKPAQTPKPPIQSFDRCLNPTPVDQTLKTRDTRWGRRSRSADRGVKGAKLRQSWSVDIPSTAANVSPLRSFYVLDAADFGLLEEAFDGGCAVPFGFELAGEPRLRHGRWRRTGRMALALVVILALHGALLLYWRAVKAPGLDVSASEMGAGGIALSLVSGQVGGAFAQTTAPSETQPDQDKGAAQTSLDDAAAATETFGQQGVDEAANAQGHSVGAVGEGDTPAPAASAGGGYDPGAFASMAPLSFTQPSEPGLWDQVRRCFKSVPPRQVTLNVVLDDKGTFVDAYKGSRELAVSAPSPEEVQTMAEALDALKGCSPYHDIKGGLARRLVLVVPGKGVTPAEGLGG